MKIENFRSEKGNGRATVLATVSWEESDRPSQEIFFETDEKFGESLHCNPHAFIVGCILPAMYHGEKRVSLKAEICPELRDGLNTVMSWIQHWFEPTHNLVKIEAKVQSYPQTPLMPRRAGLFFSGGIDSLAMLRANHLNYPPEHPGYIRDALIIFGQNIESDNRPEAFEKAVNALSEVALESGITLIPIYTNIRSLDENAEFFINQFHGAILGAVAHTFAHRLTTVYISSSDEIPTLSLIKRQHFKPFGSHPLIDPNYSSSNLQIRHEGITISRLDKTKLVADWDVALQNIKVCQPNWPSENCGRCEKCIRTMLALLALGALNKTNAFSQNDVFEDLVSKINIKQPMMKNSYSVEDNYLELIPPLMKIGRQDLVRAIEELIERYRRPKVGLKTKIRKFDQKHLKGSLTKLKQSMFS
jgi:hypothetical protein